MAKCSFGHVKMLVFGIIIIKKLKIFVVRLLVFLKLAITMPEILENMTGDTVMDFYFAVMPHVPQLAGAKGPNYHSIPGLTPSCWYI